MYLVAHFQVRIESIPWVRSQLLQTQSNTFLLLIEVKDNNVNLLVERNDVLRIGNTIPREVSDVDKTVNTTEVNEYAIVGDVLDDTFENLAFFKFANDLLFTSFEFSLDECLVANNDIAEVLIDFNNLKFHGFANEHVVVADGFNIDLAAGEECFHTEDIHDHATFGAAFDVAGNDFAFFAGFVNAIPSTRSTRFFV